MRPDSCAISVAEQWNRDMNAGDAAIPAGSFAISAAERLTPRRSAGAAAATPWA
jgi:hypothetical protein